MMDAYTWYNIYIKGLLRLNISYHLSKLMSHAIKRKTTDTIRTNNNKVIKTNNNCHSSFSAARLSSSCSLDSFQNNYYLYNECSLCQYHVS